MQRSIAIVRTAAARRTPIGGNAIQPLLARQLSCGQHFMLNSTDSTAKKATEMIKDQWEKITTTTTNAADNVKDMADELMNGKHDTKHSAGKKWNSSEASDSEKDIRADKYEGDLDDLQKKSAQFMSQSKESVKGSVGKGMDNVKDTVNKGVEDVKDGFDDVKKSVNKSVKKMFKRD